MRAFFLRTLLNLILLIARIEAAILPTSWLFAMGRWAARLGIRLSSGLRRNLEDNARHLLGEGSTLAERRALAVETLENFSRFFVELVAARRYRPPGADTLLERIRGYDAAERAKDRGRGVIGVTLHMGNYELGAQALPDLVSPVAIAYNRDPWGLFESLRSNTRRENLIEEIPVNASRFFTIEARNVLKRKGLLLAAADRGLPTERGSVYTFLGRRARFLDWPARLSVATGAPLLPCAVIRLPDEGYTIELAEPLDPADFPDAHALMQRAVEALEDFVRRFPEQWLILHRYWETQSEEEAHAAAA